MVNCPRCGMAFSAEAAEQMMSMGIVAYADCPGCRHEFLPLADKSETSRTAQRKKVPVQIECSVDLWRDDT